MAKESAPTTLLEAVTYFADAEVAHAFVANLRPDWPNGPVCPRCDSTGAGFLKTRQIWKCRECGKQFSVKVGTIFEDSAISLSKWLPAMWMIVNHKNGISSYELARAIGVTQKSAWFMLHRLRLAMQSQSFKKLNGHVEVDETFIGGKARNMHKGKLRRLNLTMSNPMVGKVAVMGVLERGAKGESQVRLQRIESNRRRHVRPVIDEHIEPGSTIYSDSLRSYRHLGSAGSEYVHAVIDHAQAYVDGNIHTNGMENFWSLLKRALKGTYVSVQPFHLFRYLDEQAYRFNNRKDTDASRFIAALRSIVSKRLTYTALTGKNIEVPQPC
jgi:transposase-like protein